MKPKSTASLNHPQHLLFFFPLHANELLEVKYTCSPFHVLTIPPQWEFAF